VTHWKTLLMGLALAAAATAHAQEEHGHGDMLVASTAAGGGALAIEYDFATVVGLAYDATLSDLLGLSAYTSTDPGFDSIEADEPEESLYRLAAGTDVTVEITAIDEGRVAVFLNGTLLDEIGDSVLLGTQDAPPPGDIHHHGEMRLLLMLPADQPGEGRFCFRLTSAAPAYAASEPSCVTVSNTHLFVDFADGDAKANLACQKAVGKSVAKLMGLYTKTLFKCLDTVAAVVSAEEQGQPMEAAEAKAVKACGGSAGVPSTLLGRLGGIVTKASAGITQKCGGAFDADQIARHLNKAACSIQFLASQAYPEAHVVLDGIDGGGGPVADALPCLVPTAAGGHE
jgi:hypothetical protein